MALSGPASAQDAAETPVTILTVPAQKTARGMSRKGLLAKIVGVLDTKIGKGLFLMTLSYIKPISVRI
jgi:hypothetical protein